jgi:hypothetical protein
MNLTWRVKLFGHQLFTASDAGDAGAGSNASSGGRLATVTNFELLIGDQRASQN